MEGPRLQSVLVLLLVLAVAFVACMTVAGENTPPRVAVHTPEEDASLALAVTVSGKATDTEGFNIESYVEARWNEWEWFLLPNTPADGNRSIVFGELVNLDFHAPGDHTLYVRAFDGELHSEVVQVDVTVRDLADLVILPTDITMDPENVREGETAILTVLVRNQGGEEVPDVEVVLTIDGNEIGRPVVETMAPHSESSVSFTVTLEEGNWTVMASAFSLENIEERTETNNQAQRSFNVRSPEDPVGDWLSFPGIVGVIILVIALILVGIYVHAVVASRKD
jgi:hypothetical protein